MSGWQALALGRTVSQTRSPLRVCRSTYVARVRQWRSSRAWATGPRGTEINARSFQSSDADSVGSSNPVLNLIAGSYTLAVAGSGDHTLSPGNSTASYQFNASAGDLFYFDALTSSFLYDWRLIDPFGHQVWYQQNGADVATQALAFTGTYTLLIEGSVSNSSTVNYSFNAQKVTNTTAALTLGSQVSGSITQAGQQSSYTFSLANAGKLYFDSLTNDSSLTWTLVGPRGTEVSQVTFLVSGNLTSSNPVFNVIAGNYTLTIAGSGDHTGSYTFILSDLASATAITPGVAVSGTLTPGTVSNLYRFNAQAGDPFYFDAVSLSPTGNTYWRLPRRHGRRGARQRRLLHRGPARRRSERHDRKHHAGHPGRSAGRGAGRLPLSGGFRPQCWSR